MDLALVGATATGKTALALELARRVPDIELVSVDSMAVYKGMDIGTEKPGAPPHWHLVDIADPDEEFSVAVFQTAAREAVAGIHGRGRRAVFVGGTGLYHRAALGELEIPGTYETVRQQLETAARRNDGLESLFDQLRALDPLAASRIEPGNERRIIRALEVTLGSGRPFSSFGPGLDQYRESSVRLAGLSIDRAELDSCLLARLETELAAGWLQEVSDLAARPGGLSRTASQAIGYAELLAHLSGELSLDDARDQIYRRLKNFARRQESWFRRDPRVVWFDANRPDLAEAILHWWDLPVAETASERETEKR